eukprot:gene17634-biopygen11539
MLLLPLWFHGAPPSRHPAPPCAQLRQKERRKGVPPARMVPRCAPPRATLRHPAPSCGKRSAAGVFLPSVWFHEGAPLAPPYATRRPAAAKGAPHGVFLPPVWFREGAPLAPPCITLRPAAAKGAPQGCSSRPYGSTGRPPRATLRHPAPSDSCCDKRSATAVAGLPVGFKDGVFLPPVWFQGRPLGPPCVVVLHA